jgi:hypothetical protein
MARATADVDLKVLLGREEAVKLAEVLEANGFHILGGEALELLQRYGMVFATDASRVRIDFLLSDVDFDRAAIESAVLTDFGQGRSARVVRAEDLIIYKLLSSRDRDRADALSVLQRQTDLDLEHIRDWLRKFEGALDDTTLVAGFENLLRDAT